MGWNHRPWRTDCQSGLVVQETKNVCNKLVGVAPCCIMDAGKRNNMKLYLVRHGEALPKGVDSKRPLSPEGRREVNSVGAFLVERGVRVSRVAHSGKERARQTAEILAEGVLAGGSAEAVAGLDPTDPVDPWITRIETWSDGAMLVGHLPFMGLLAARLVADGEEGDMLRFQAGAVACFEKTASDRWDLAWMIAPAMLAP